MHAFREKESENFSQWTNWYEWFIHLLHFIPRVVSCEYGSHSFVTPLMQPRISRSFTTFWIYGIYPLMDQSNEDWLICTILSSELSVVKMAPILSRPLGRLLVPSLSRAMSSGYLVHEPKYSFLKVKQWQQKPMCSPISVKTWEEWVIMMLQDLGLEESNKGVYDGTWKGSGEVTWVDLSGIKNQDY